MRRSRRLLAALAAGALLLLGACSDGDGDDGASTDGDDTEAATEGTDVTDVTDEGGEAQPPTEDGLQDAGRGYAQALLDGDIAAAYGYASEACRAQISADEFDELITDALDTVESEEGVELSELQVSAVMTRNVTDTTGELRVDVEDAEGNPVRLDDDDTDYDEWVYEDGGWRFGGCDGAETDGTTSST